MIHIEKKYSFHFTHPDIYLFTYLRYFIILLFVFESFSRHPSAIVVFIFLHYAVVKLTNKQKTETIKDGANTLSQKSS